MTVADDDRARRFDTLFKSEPGRDRLLPLASPLAERRPRRRGRGLPHSLAPPGRCASTLCSSRSSPVSGGTPLTGQGLSFPCPSSMVCHKCDTPTIEDTMAQVNDAPSKLKAVLRSAFPDAKVSVRADSKARPLGADWRRASTWNLPDSACLSSTSEPSPARD